MKKSKDTGKRGQDFNGVYGIERTVQELQTV